jgi:hypothetical protein
LKDETLAVPAAKVEFLQGAANTSDFGPAYAGPPSKILLMLFIGSIFRWSRRNSRFWRKLCLIIARQ